MNKITVTLYFDLRNSPFIHVSVLILRIFILYCFKCLVCRFVKNAIKTHFKSKYFFLFYDLKNILDNGLILNNNYYKVLIKP